MSVIPTPCNCKQTVITDNKPPVVEESSSPITNSVIQTVHIHTDRMWVLAFILVVSMLVGGYLYFNSTSDITPLLPAIPPTFSSIDQERANYLYQKTNTYVVREFAEGELVKQKLMASCISNINYDFTDYQIVSTNWKRPVVSVLVFTGERNEYGVEKAKYDYRGGTQLELGFTRSTSSFLPTPTNKNDIIVTNIKWRPICATDGDIIHIKYTATNMSTNTFSGLKLFVSLLGDAQKPIFEKAMWNMDINEENLFYPQNTTTTEFIIPMKSNQSILIKNVVISVNKIK